MQAHRPGQVERGEAYERGRREAGAWAEAMGIMEGTLYGHSLRPEGDAFCLRGTAKDQVREIAQAMASESFERSPVLMDDVPTRAQAIEFLSRFFPCRQAAKPP